MICEYLIADVIHIITCVYLTAVSTEHQMITCLLKETNATVLNL
jgi:hypothetical protein